MSKFIAIPVSVGDAFHLNINDHTILVDGGQDMTGFPHLFLQTIKDNKVNVVVCTHNDADHANGIIGLLKAGISCDEIWLPGSWIDVLPEILRPIDDVVKVLVDNIKEDKQLSRDDNPNSNSPLLETYCDKRSEWSEQNKNKGEAIDLHEDGWSDKLIVQLEKSAPWDSIASQHGEFSRYKYFYHFIIDGLDSAEIELLWSAIDAARRIRSIAQEAFHRGIPVRWFQYDTSLPASGGDSYLQPLNAQEIATVRVKPVGVTLLFLLSLSVSNKESLVFWSPPMDQKPGVLFTADSDLQNVRLPKASDFHSALATAPHHGSDSNRSIGSDSIDSTEKLKVDLPAI